MIMRKCISHQIEINQDRYACYLKGCSIKTYCEQLKLNLPGNNFCILAACELFQVTFRALLDHPFFVLKEIAPATGVSRKIIWSSLGDGCGIYPIQRNMNLGDLCGIRPIQRNTQDKDIDDVDFQQKLSWLQQNLDDPLQSIDICNRLMSHLRGDAVPVCIYQRHHPSWECDDLKHYEMCQCDDRRHYLRIREWGFKLVEMKGDGNCMFRTLSFFNFKTQEQHEDIRKMIVAKLKTNRSRYSRLCAYNLDEDFEKYLKRMARPKEWGDHVCLQAAADMFQIKITLLRARKDFIFQEIVPMGDYYVREIHCAMNSCHMDALLPLEEHKKHMEAERRARGLI